MRFFRRKETTSPPPLRYVVAGYNGAAVALIPFGHLWSPDKIQQLCETLIGNSPALALFTDEVVLQLHVLTFSFTRLDILAARYYWTGSTLWSQGDLDRMNSLFRFPGDTCLTAFVPDLRYSSTAPELPRAAKDNAMSMYEGSPRWPRLMRNPEYSDRLEEAALKLCGIRLPLAGFREALREYELYEYIKWLNPRNPHRRLLWNVFNKHGRDVPRLMMYGYWDIWNVARHAFMSEEACAAGKGMMRLEDGNLVGETITEVPRQSDTQP